MRSLADRIPECLLASTSLQKIALSLGFSLLKELAFKFATYALEDVQEPVIEKVLLAEYSTILESIVLSATIY